MNRRDWNDKLGRMALTAAALFVVVACSAASAAGGGAAARSKRKFRPSNLQDLRASAKVFLRAPVRFDADFIQRGDLYRPFYTRLNESDYVNFQVWPAGSELWKPEARKDVFPFLYIIRNNERLNNALDKLELFQTVRLYGEVVSTNGNFPWIVVSRIEVLKDARKFNRNSIKNLAIGIEMADHDEHGLAVRRFRTAMEEGLPPAGELAALRHMGLSLYQLERYDEAQRVLRLVVSRTPNDAQLLLRLGQSVLELATADRRNIDPDRLAFARDTLRRVTRIEPGDTWAMADLGLSQAYLGNFEGALRNCNDAIRLRPQFDHAMRNLGVIYRLMKRPNKAIKWYEDAINLQADARNLHKELGELYMEDLKDYDKAEEEFGVLLPLYKKDPELPTLRARARVANGKLAGAKADIQTAFAIQENYPEAHRVAALIAVEEKNWDEAVKHLQALIDLEPDDSVGTIALSEYYRDRKDYGSAIEIMNKLLAQDIFAGDPAANQELARSFENQDRPDLNAAVGVLERGIATYVARGTKANDPGYRSVLYEAAIDYRQLGQFKRAIRHLETIRADSPRAYKSLLYLGLSYLSVGSAGKAEAVLQEAARLHAKDSAARVWLAEIALARRQNALALRHATNANTNNPGDAHAMALYGHLAYRAEKIDKYRLKELMSRVATVDHPWVGLYRYKSARDMGVVADKVQKELEEANKSLNAFIEKRGVMAKRSVLVRQLQNRLRRAPRERYTMAPSPRRPAKPPAP